MNLFKKKLGCIIMTKEYNEMETFVLKMVTLFFERYKDESFEKIVIYLKGNGISEEEIDWALKEIRENNNSIN